MLDKNLKNKLRDASSTLSDKVTFKKSGEVVFKRSYFYRHGMTAEKFGLVVTNRLKALGVEPKAVEAEDHWAPWPRDSFFSATVTF